MGDSVMPELEMDNVDVDKSKVIDYAHSIERSAELDIALCASCKLFVSSPSGLHVVANTFGRPVCYVNFPIYAGFPWHPGQIFIPMMYYSLSSHQLLSIEEILSSNLVHADHGHLLTMENVMLLRNTPDEIAETVLEALEQEDYKMHNKQYNEDVRQEFEALNQKYERDISGKIGLYFANKHKDKLFPLDKKDTDEKLVA
jgi:putative glycosyltransferase (TIGR04372 family)